MTTRFRTTLLAVVAVIAVCGPANAGGWSGDDSSILRARLVQGHTLKPIWQRINDR